jgi:hypothetical protein
MGGKAKKEGEKEENPVTGPQYEKKNLARNII